MSQDDDGMGRLERNLIVATRLVVVACVLMLISLALFAYVVIR